MITFENYFKENIQDKSITHKISTPDKPILRVEYCPTTMKYLVSGTVCIINLSKFVDIAPASVTVFYILINDESIEFDTSSIANYVLLNRDVDSEAIFSQALSLLLSERLVDNAYNAITHALFKKSSIKTLLEITADLINCPIFLSDSSTKVLSSSDEKELEGLDDELISCVLDKGFVTADLFEKYKYPKLLKKIANSKEPFYLKSDTPKKLNRIIANINVNNRHFGWLVAVVSSDNFKPEYCKILDILSNVISIELERNKTNLSISSSENLLLDLLTGSFACRKEFDNRARGFGWDLNKDFIVMIMSWRNEIDNKSEIGLRSMMAYKNQLSIIFPESKSIYIKDRLVLIFENRNFEIMVNNLEIFLRNNNLIASTSDIFSNIIDFKRYYEQASEILNIGLQLRKDNIIFYYHDFYLYHCINTLKQTGNIEYYCLPELIDVVLYDKKNNTELAKTVYTYLNFRNIVKTANHLNIHRNTLVYRLERFKDLTNVDLTSGNDIYKLWLSYLILELSPDLICI